MWPVGTKLAREHSPEQGVGIVVELDGRFAEVFFPDTGERLKLTVGAPGTAVVELEPGRPARRPDGSVGIIETLGATARFTDGVECPPNELWPVVVPPSLVERLVAGDTDSYGDLKNRARGLELDDQRRAGGVAALIGGRIELFPHQLATAAKALAEPQVRWLLADEVGLGKTVSASLIIASLVRTGRVDCAIVVAPDALTIQWLGELYRKFHQVFVHIDAERLQAVRANFGADVNPFDVHPFAIVGAEFLSQSPRLRELVALAEPDLIVIDEAHQGVAPLDLARLAHHCLLLSSSAFAQGEAGFSKLLDAAGIERQSIGPHGLARRVSAVTRADLPEMPARLPRPVDLGDDVPESVRLDWLVDAAKRWHSRGEKSLVFVNATESAEQLKAELEKRTGVRVWTFHDGMDHQQRDIQLAEFRASTCPVLVSSGAGSEGRNFQFCDRVVHYELPFDPLLLEQRIGRVDRLGRDEDVEVVYFERDELAQVYAAAGLFGSVTDGTSPALEPLRNALAGSEGDLNALIALAEAYASRRDDGPDRPIFPDTFDPETVADVQAQIPEESEELVRKFVLGAARRVGLDVIDKGGVRRTYLEYGGNSVVDAIPGVHDGSRFLGTFDREEAISASELDFFASGHELVEGLLWELDDSPAGRVGALAADIASPALYTVFRGADGRPLVLRHDAAGATECAPKELREFLSECEPADVPPPPPSLGEDGEFDSAEMIVWVVPTPPSCGG